MQQISGDTIQQNNYSGHLKELLDHIYSVRGIDFSLYRSATIMRKLDLRMDITKSGDYAEYLSFLRSDPEELHKLVQTLTIKVSSFFRNRQVFEALRLEVLPQLVSCFGSVRAWSIGCANGEEPYSLAIIAKEMMNAGKGSFSLNIYGTDLDPDAIIKAEKGEYTDEELVETAPEYIARYFSKTGDQHSEYGHERWLLSREVRSMVQFGSYNIMDLLTDRRPHPGKYNLILCRNLLIYLNLDLQERIFNAISHLLYEDGYLVIGEAETLPEPARSRFGQHADGLKIFRKLGLTAEH
jgi:chemotaxis methyl-accepting protein methylase